MGSLNLVYGNFSYVCIMEYQKDVHTEHCCLRHGCKYGDPNCTVENGTKPQSWDCEQCEWEFSDENSEYRLMKWLSDNGHLVGDFETIYKKWTESKYI